MKGDEEIILRAVRSLYLQADLGDSFLETVAAAFWVETGDFRQ